MSAWRQEGTVGMEADGWEVEVVVDTAEKEQMGMRRKNNWEAGRKTILEADDQIKQLLESFLVLR